MAAWRIIRQFLGDTSRLTKSKELSSRNEDLGQFRFAPEP